jgi:hypothetical protein
MALAGQIPEACPPLPHGNWEIPPALTVIKIVTVDADGNSGGEVTPVV